MIPEALADKTAVVSPSSVTLDDGHTIAYGEYGDPDGTPVVFFHGTPGSRILAGLFDSAATAAGVRLLTFDRPGFGRSDPWPTRSISDAGTVVTAVLDDADVTTTSLLAFSGGSQHAIATAATDSDQITNVHIVSGATPPAVSDSTPPLQRALGTLATRSPLVLRGLFRGQAWVAEKREPSFVVSQYRADDLSTSIDNQVAMTVKADFLEAVSNSRHGVVTEFQNSAAAWGIDLSALDIPIAFWHGSNDTNAPLEDVRRFKRAVPNGTLRVNKTADHIQTLIESVPAIFEDTIELSDTIH